jgi:hypothetical protein
MKTNSNTQMGNNKNPRTVPPGNRQNKDVLDSREGEEQIIKGDTITNNKKPARNSGKKSKKDS